MFELEKWHRFGAFDSWQKVNFRWILIASTQSYSHGIHMCLMQNTTVSTNVLFIKKRNRRTKKNARKRNVSEMWHSIWNVIRIYRGRANRFKCESAYVCTLSLNSQCTHTTMWEECAHHTSIETNVYGYVLICFSFDIERPQIFTRRFCRHKRFQQNNFECKRI